MAASEWNSSEISCSVRNEVSGIEDESVTSSEAAAEVLVVVSFSDTSAVSLVVLEEDCATAESCPLLTLEVGSLALLGAGLDTATPGVLEAKVLSFTFPEEGVDFNKFFRSDVDEGLRAPFSCGSEYEEREWDAMLPEDGLTEENMALSAELLRCFFIFYKKV